LKLAFRFILALMFLYKLFLNQCFVLIDVVTLLVLDAPVPGERILAAIPSTRRVGSKPFAVEASNAATGEWEIPVQANKKTERNGSEVLNLHAVGSGSE
jgi:hypothetical protein